MTSKFTPNSKASSNAVIDGTKPLDPSKVKFGPLNRLQNGSKSVRITYNNSALRLQTPSDMTIPWNVTPPYSDKDKNEDDLKASTQGMKKYSLQLSFKGHDSKNPDKKSKDLQTFYENMMMLDKLFLETIVEHRADWFGNTKPMTNEAASTLYEHLYRPAVRHRKNKVTNEAYPPTIEPKVNCLDGVFQCNVFNSNREQYEKPIDKIILKGTSGQGIIQLTNFYIQQTSCGPTWTLIRLRADEQASLNDFGFVDFDEDGASADPKPKANVQIADSDESDDENVTPAKGDAEDSEDEEEEEEPEPEPEPVVKKTAKKPAAAAPAKGKKA
jgi:hypothetical protein